jgi:IS605 OrfB family transposase
MKCDEALVIENFRKQIGKRNRVFQGSQKFSTRVGHGRRRAFAPQMKLFDKERNFRTAKYHQYTSRIIKFALRQNAGFIQIEKLESILAGRKGILWNWAIADFYGKLKYKAQHAGIEVREVVVTNANRQCSKCGNVDDTDSANQQDFLCILCGYEEHADFNAARNMARIVSMKSDAAETG